MKKNLSIIASLLLTSPLFANNNLATAFENSKVSGEVKTAYVNSNFLGASDYDSVLALGGKLGIITDNFYGLKLGATFQTSHVLTDDLSSTNVLPFNVNGISKRTDYFNASGSVLSEAYLAYTFSNTSLKAGRQFINTPLVSSGNEGKSSEAIIKDSFEAYVLTNTDIPNTTLIAGYVDKWQAQSDGNGNVGSFKNVEDGAYTIYAKNNSIENLTLQAQYLDVKGIASTGNKDSIYLQADYKFGPQTISAQYISSTDKSQAANAQDGKLFGLKATGPLGLGKLGYLVAYNSSTDKNAPIYLGAGEGVTDTPFTAMPVHDGGVPTRPDTDTAVAAVVIPAAGTTVIPYTGKSFSKTHALGDVTAYGTIFVYPVNKDLLLKANYEYVSCEKVINKNTNTTRVYLSYKF